MDFHHLGFRALFPAIERLEATDIQSDRRDGVGACLANRVEPVLTRQLALNRPRPRNITQRAEATTPLFQKLLRSRRRQ
ncbi:hypothetical protein ACRAWD_04390 [Caulobacter segnis]